MDKTFTIGEISKRLNISTAALRFWEEKGLFSVNKGENRYRLYTERDLVRIADIIYYRNLGVPIREMNHFINCPVEQYGENLEKLQGELIERIADYQHIYRRTMNRKESLKELKRLMQCRFAVEEVPFFAVEPFDFLEGEKLLQYIHDPSSYVWYADTADLTKGARGIIVSEKKKGHPLLWEKKADETYITFLVREKIDQGYQWDIEETLELVKESYQTGKLLTRYLFSATEKGERIEYLKAFLEVKERVKDEGNQY